MNISGPLGCIVFFSSTQKSGYSWKEGWLSLTATDVLLEICWQRTRAGNSRGVLEPVDTGEQEQVEGGGTRGSEEEVREQLWSTGSWERERCGRSRMLGLQYQGRHSGIMTRPRSDCTTDSGCPVSEYKISDCFGTWMWISEIYLRV